MKKHPKAVRKALRELAERAFERELTSALTALAEKFEAWKRGEIEAGELSDCLHDYDRGPARDLFSLYNCGDDEMLVAGALVRGVLSKSDVPVEVWAVLEARVQDVKEYQSTLEA